MPPRMHIQSVLSSKSVRRPVVRRQSRSRSADITRSRIASTTAGVMHSCLRHAANERSQPCNKPASASKRFSTSTSRTSAGRTPQPLRRSMENHSCFCRAARHAGSEKRRLRQGPAKTTRLLQVRRSAIVKSCRAPRGRLRWPLRARQGAVEDAIRIGGGAHFRSRPLCDLSPPAAAGRLADRLPTGSRRPYEARPRARTRLAAHTG